MSTVPESQSFSWQPDMTGPRPHQAMEKFRSWLIHHKGYSDRAASSHVSLCRRVERELALSLDPSVKTDAGLAGVIDRIREEILTNASDKRRIEGQASLTSATRRYAEFLARQPGTDPVPSPPIGRRSPRIRPRRARVRTSTVIEHSLRSSYRELLLEHLFAGAVMRHLWLKGLGRMELLKPHVDDGGYDLVLEANGVVRHVQLKAPHNGAATREVPLNTALAEKPSGCVIWLRFDPESLDLGPFLWFGGAPGEKLPDLASFKAAKHTKANSQGVKLERPNIRCIPIDRFEHLATIDEVVAHLFGV